MRKIFLALTCCVLTVFAVACEDDTPPGETSVDTAGTGDTSDTDNASVACVSDVDCGFGFVCRPEFAGGENRCIPDDGGGTGETDTGDTDTGGETGDTDTTGETGETDTTGDEVTCRAVADCAPDRICVVGKCELPTTCTVDSAPQACPLDQFCDPSTGTCVKEKLYDCATDIECEGVKDPAGFETPICDRDTYRCVGCRTTQDCDPTNPESPNFDTACNPNLNRCQPVFSCRRKTGGNEGCTQVPAPQLCNYETGLCGPEGCANSEAKPCAEENPLTPVCNENNGLCVQCVNDADCAVGSVCRSFECRSSSPDDCGGTCGEGLVCADGLCQNPNGKGVGQACSFSGECKAGLVCVPGLQKCEEKCARNADCPAGETCVADPSGSATFCDAGGAGGICSIFPIPGLCP